MLLALVPPQVVPIKLDPVQLVLHASGPVFFVVWGLLFASLIVWIVAVLKLLQLWRLGSTEATFEREAVQARSPEDLFQTAVRFRDAPGARIVLEIAKRAGSAKVLEAVAKRAIVEEQARASSLMAILSSIASAGPFVGLFGTVYGIMDAFLRIGMEKSASLPVVAPAIGEALIATLIGLFAAIPATVAYNGISKWIDEMLSALEASAEGWVALIANEPAAMPLRTPSNRPPPQPAPY